jgi:DNA sulfur modification protein DndB
VEFLSDSPGKYSAKLFSFKTIRYLSGTVLIGVGQRSTAGWDKAVNIEAETNEEWVRETLHDLWEGLGNLPDFAAIISGDKTTAEVREQTYLSSAGVQYAIAYALHRALTEHEVAIGDAMTILSAVNFDRAGTPGENERLTKADTIFAGTLVDPESGKVGSGRPAWEAASDDLLKIILEG